MILPSWSIKVIDLSKHNFFSFTANSEALGFMKSTDIISSEPEDSEAFFDPSNDKMYRHPTFYSMPKGSKYI